MCVCVRYSKRSASIPSLTQEQNTIKVKIITTVLPAAKAAVHSLNSMSASRSDAYLLEIEGLFTQGWRPGRTVGESVGGIFEMDGSDWSNGIRYHTFDTRPDTEFKQSSEPSTLVHICSERDSGLCTRRFWAILGGCVQCWAILAQVCSTQNTPSFQVPGLVRNIYLKSALVVHGGVPRVPGFATRTSTAWTTSTD